MDRRAFLLAAAAVAGFATPFGLGKACKGHRCSPPPTTSTTTSGGLFGAGAYGMSVYGGVA